MNLILLHILNSFWKQAVTKQYDKKTIKKAVKSMVKKGDWEVLKSLKSNCELSLDDRVTLFYEITD